MIKKEDIKNDFRLQDFSDYDYFKKQEEYFCEALADRFTEQKEIVHNPDKHFKAVTDKMNVIYKAKNHDYGNSFSELFKDCGMTYAYGHIAEKLSRIKSLMKDEAKVKGESMKDSLYDLANYAILTIMELEKEK